MAELTDQEFVEYIVKAIVSKPEKVTTQRTVDEMGVLIELTVDAEDMGKVIGKEGRTAKAIRTLLRVIGAQHNARVNLKIMEPEGGTGPRQAVEVSEEVSEEAPEEENGKTLKSSLMEELGEEEEEKKEEKDEKEEEKKDEE